MMAGVEEVWSEEGSDRMRVCRGSSWSELLSERWVAVWTRRCLREALGCTRWWARGGVVYGEKRMLCVEKGWVEGGSGEVGCGRM